MRFHFNPQHFITSSLTLLFLSFLSLSTCTKSPKTQKPDPHLKKQETELIEEAKKLEAKGQTTALEVSVCDRTEAIKQAILKKLKKTDCAAVKAEHLKSILFLDLSYKEISAIEAKDFSGLINLKRLDLDSNDLLLLPSGLFNKLTSLETLKINSNNITLLSPNIFDKLVNLKVLNIESNEIIHLSPNIFDKLVNLKVLNIGHNNFRLYQPVSLINLLF